MQRKSVNILMLERREGVKLFYHAVVAIVRFVRNTEEMQTRESEVTLLKDKYPFGTVKGHLYG